MEHWIKYNKQSAVDCPRNGGKDLHSFALIYTVAAPLFPISSFIHWTFIDSQSVAWHSVTVEEFSFDIRVQRQSLPSIIVKMCFLTSRWDPSQTQALIDTGFNKVFNNDVSCFILRMNEDKARVNYLTSVVNTRVAHPCGKALQALVTTVTVRDVGGHMPVLSFRLEDIP